mgnify:CR=1 FL=1
MSKRILYVAATTSRLYHEMLPFMEMMSEKGYIVEAAACPDQSGIYLLNQRCLQAFHPIGPTARICSRNACRAYRKIKELLAGNPYQLIHTNDTALSFLVRIAARKHPDTKIVYMAHGLGFYRDAPLGKYLGQYPAESIASRFTEEMVTLNLEDFITAKDAFPRTRVHYIPSAGIDLDAYQPMQYMRAGYKVILCMGELTREKNQRQILQSIVHLKGMTKGFKVWFVGEGPMLGHYQTLARRLGIDDYVEWLGFRRDIKTLLYKSDIAVSASRREGVSRGLLMAMACAKPVVATDIRGHRELIAEGVNGYAAPTGDAKAFACACAKLMTHPDLLQMGAASRIMSLKYDLEYVKQRMAYIYGV